jgi:urea transport system ATP-binding protein
MEMLRLEQLEVGYGESSVLRDINLQVDSNQVVCIMGRNGVGKTTIMKTVIGLLKPSRGKVYFQDQDITGFLPSERARYGIGYVPQGREIFNNLTIYENLLLGLEANPRVTEIAPFIYEYFPVLKEMANRKGGDLSGGQQQQLAIARALVSHPGLILFDEPTEGIQPNIVQDIRGVIRDIKETMDTSILLVEQNLDFAIGVADYLYIIDNGMVVLEGRPAELTEDEIHQYLSF